MKSFSFFFSSFFFKNWFCNREGKKCLEITFIGTQTRGRKTYDSHQRLTSVRLFIYFTQLLVLARAIFTVSTSFSQKKKTLRRSSDGMEKEIWNFSDLDFVSRKVALRLLQCDIFRVKFFVRLFLSMLPLVFISAKTEFRYASLKVCRRKFRGRWGGVHLKFCVNF